MSILTREQASKLASYRLFPNGDYGYRPKAGFWHLIRNGVNLLEGLRAVDCSSYANNDYRYRTKNGYRHLIRDGVDLLKGLKVVICYCNYSNGDYNYKTADGEWYTIKNN